MQVSDQTAPLHPPVRSAMVWGALNLSVGQLGGFVVFIVLARLLPPATFGVFATAALFADFVANYGKYALSDALIIERIATREERSSVFWGACAATMVLAVVITLCGVAGEHVMAMDGLGRTTALLALCLVFSPSQAVMEAQLLGRMEVRSLAIRNMSTTIIGGVAGVSTAFSAAPEWALVAQRAAQAATSVILLWRVTGFSPLPLKGADMGLALKVLRRAGGIWRNSLLSVAPRSIALSLAGASIGAAAAGVYRVFERIVEMAQYLFLHPTTNLVVPSLSRATADAKAGQALMLLRNLCLFCAPAFTGIALLAPRLAAVLFGGTYAPHALLLTLMALSSLSGPLTTMRFVVLGAMGRSGLLTALLAVEALLSVLVFSLLRHAGLAGLGQGLVIVFACAAVLSCGAIVSALSLDWRRLAGAIAPAYLGAILMAGVLMLAGVTGVSNGDTFRLVLDIALYVALGAAAYGAYLFVAHRAWLLEALGAIGLRRK